MFLRVYAGVGFVFAGAALVGAIGCSGTASEHDGDPPHDAAPSLRDATLPPSLGDAAFVPAAAHDANDAAAPGGGGAPGDKPGTPPKVMTPRPGTSKPVTPVPPPAARGFAFCQELIVKSDSANVTSRDGNSVLTRGDQVIRTNSRRPFGLAFAVAFLDDAGRIRFGDIPANDVTDGCPDNAFEAHYIVNNTRFASDASEAPAQHCALHEGQVLRINGREFDSKVSRTKIKLTLAAPIPGCDLATGFVPSADALFVVAYPSDKPSQPIFQPTRQQRAAPAHEAAPGGRVATPPPPPPGGEARVATPPPPAGAGEKSRCVLRERSIWINNSQAFLFANNDAAVSAYEKLDASGACTGSRLGATTYGVTIDGGHAFYEHGNDARLKLLLDLTAAGVGKVADRCSANTHAVTVDDHSAFYEHHAKRRADLLIALTKGGACQKSRLGITTDGVTIDGGNAFYEHGNDARLKLLLDLTAAGVGKVADRCSANTHAVTIDGHNVFYTPNATNRADLLIALTKGGACQKSRLGATADSVTIDGHIAFRRPFFVGHLRDPLLTVLLRLTEAGVGKPDCRCLVLGNTIRNDGAILATEDDQAKRIDMLIRLAQTDACK